MATEIASAYVSLVPSARGITRGITRELSGVDPIARQVGSQASQSIHSRLTSGFSRTISDMGRMARRGGLAIGAGLGIAGGFAIKTAADFEQTQIAFEGILGNKGAADKLIASLRELANVSPFEFTDLSKAARQLLAVGYGADEIVPAMESIGNVAATLGVGKYEIEGVVRALGQMRGKGKVSAEELRQISEAFPGFSAIGSLAEGLGVSVSELADVMEQKGGILAQFGVDGAEGIDLIIEGMDKFPGAAGAMDRQAQTLNGTISTFKDVLSTTAIDFVTPYLPAFSDGVRRFSGFLSGTIVPGLHTVVDYITDHVIPTVKNFVDDALGAIRRWWDRNGESITTAATTLGTVVVGALGTIATWIWVTGLPALDGFRDWFVNNNTAIAAALGAIATGFLIWGINAAFAAASTIIANAPLLILVGLVAAAAAGLYYAYTHSDSFRESVDKLIPLATTLAEQFFSMWISLVGIVAALDAISRKIPVFKDSGLAGIIKNGVEAGVPGLGLLDGVLARGGPAGPGNYLVGEEGPEILSLGAGQHGYVTPNHALSTVTAGGGGPLIGNLTVVERPGEDQATTVVRELRKVRLTGAA